MGDALNPAIFSKGAIRAEAANIKTSGSDGVRPSNSDTAGDALVTNSAAQTSQEGIGAQGSGADPLNKPAEQPTPDQQVEEKPLAEQPLETAPEADIKSEEGSVDGETVEGEPPADADLQSVRKWGKGLLGDLNTIKPVVEEVMQLGGLEKLKISASLYDALASPDFAPGDVLSALQQMSEPRFEAITQEVFKANEDRFLKHLGLNPAQFKIAAKAVLEGRPVTSEDVASADIPFDLSPEAWDAIPSEEQQRLQQRAQEARDSQQRELQAEQQRKQAEVRQEQTQWAEGLDKLITETCDTFKIPADEAGNSLREKVRRNVWAALSSDPKVAQHFYASMEHFSKGEVTFAKARTAQLENYIRDAATEEVSYYTENQRLKNELDKSKLSHIGERKEIAGNDVKENLSVNTGQNGNVDLANLFNKATLKEEAAQLRR